MQYTVTRNFNIKLFLSAHFSLSTFFSKNLTNFEPVLIKDNFLTYKRNVGRICVDYQSGREKKTVEGYQLKNEILIFVPESI